MLSVGKEGFEPSPTCSKHVHAAVTLYFPILGEAYGGIEPPPSAYKTLVLPLN
jgi:hypothetical protein